MKVHPYRVYLPLQFLRRRHFPLNPGVDIRDAVEFTVP